MKVEDDGEHAFRVTTDASSKVALSVSGKELFSDIAAPSRQAVSALSRAIDRYTTDADADGRDTSSSPSATAVTAAGAGTSAATLPETTSEGRTGYVLLKAGQLIPLQLHYVVSNQRFSHKSETAAAAIWLCWIPQPC